MKQLRRLSRRTAHPHHTHLLAKQRPAEMIYRQTLLAPADTGVELGHSPEEGERQCEGELGDGRGVGSGAVWSSAGERPTERI